MAKNLSIPVTLSVIAARCHLPRGGRFCSTYRQMAKSSPLRGKTSPAPGEDVAQRQKGESGCDQREQTERVLSHLHK